MNDRLRWIEDPVRGPICPDCNKEALFFVCGIAFARSFGSCRSNFCPHCGADMRKEQNNDER